VCKQEWGIHEIEIELEEEEEQDLVWHAYSIEQCVTNDGKTYEMWVDDVKTCMTNACMNQAKLKKRETDRMRHDLFLSHFCLKHSKIMCL